MKSESPKSAASHLLLVSSLLVVGCGSTAPEPQSAQPAKPESSSAEPAQKEETKQIDTGSPEFQKKQKGIADLGAALVVSSQCNLAAVRLSKIVGGQDYLHTLTELNLDKASTSVCQMKLFSPTDGPRLQWVTDLTKERGKDGAVKIKRNRPETYRPPNDEEASQLLAIQLVRKSIQGSPIMVPVVFDTKPDLLVYLLTVSTDEKKIATGPHFRAVTSGDGKTIKATMQLSAPGEAQMLSPSGDKATAIQVEAVDADMPNEGHIFTSGKSEIPLLVPTRTGTWKVDGLKLSLLDQ